MDTQKSWRPYITGALTGLLAIASVWVSTRLLEKPKYLGASTTFVRSAGMLEKTIAAEHVQKNAYFQSKKVKIDWQFMVLVGIGLGALGASLISKSWQAESVPPLWQERFGTSVPLRAILAFAGGAVAMFGARMAGGCPSGHGLSGMMQLSISGYLAMAGFFGAGVLVANLLYRRKEV